MSTPTLCHTLRLELPVVAEWLSRKISALLHTGREDDIGQVRFHQGLCLVQVIQMTVVKRIVFRNNAEDCHTGFLLFSKGGYGVSVAF